MDSFPIALKIIEKLQQIGGVAYIAGGAVRDFLMGLQPSDIDIVTSLPVDAIRPLFKKTIEVGIQFGIIIVVEDNHKFEIATFRTDLEYKDGRRPTIIMQSSPEEDAKRRDFTINGMFLNPLTNETLDYVGGKEDLKERVIRAIGNPHDRFREDRLRMIRAIRYAARFEFSIDPLTQEAIKEHAPTLLPAVSFERILQEFDKIHKDGNLKKALTTMHRLGLLATLFPPLKETDTLALEALEKPENVPVVLQLKALLEHVCDEERFHWIQRLRFSQKDLDLLLFSDALLLKLEKGNLQQRLHLYASPFFEDASFLLPKEARGYCLDELQIYNEQINRIKGKKPLVTAQDLIEKGLSPGPQGGAYLKKAEEIAITHKLDDKKEILDRLFPT